MSVASSVAWAFALFSGVFFGSSILRLQYALTLSISSASIGRSNFVEL